MDIKVIYVNSDGLDQEHSEAADSVKFLSYKTANKELTDAKLARLIDGADAADEHIHDARYFRENEHISTSAGAADAAKPVLTDAAGKLSSTFINITTLNPLLDHGNLLTSSLLDDDHPQYLKTDGTRDLTGVQKYSVHPSFNDDKQLVDKKYVDDIILRSEWFPFSAKDFITNNTLTPPAAVAGDVYVLSAAGGIPAAGWAGAAAGDIVRYDGSTWVKTTPTTGTKITVDDETDVAYYFFGGTGWTPKYNEVSTASTGLVKVGFDIQIDPGAAGAGLGFTAGVLNVNVDASSIEINVDTLRVKALGIKDTMIDFGTGAGQVSGVDLPLADAGNYFTAKNTEAALQYLAKEILENGVEYTSAGVTKGDLLFVSANDVASKYATLTNNTHCIGLAASTVAVSGTVTVLADDTILKGVLAGAVAGTPYFWNGTTFVTAIPTTAGANVWKVGVAKNATDLHVEVQHIKKNA